MSHTSVRKGKDRGNALSQTHKYAQEKRGGNSVQCMWGGDPHMTQTINAHFQAFNNYTILADLIAHGKEIHSTFSDVIIDVGLALVPLNTSVLCATVC